jgi:hypothetical protein
MGGTKSSTYVVYVADTDISRSYYPYLATRAVSGNEVRSRYVAPFGLRKVLVDKEAQVKISRQPMDGPNWVLYHTIESQLAHSGVEIKR